MEHIFLRDPVPEAMVNGATNMATSTTMADIIIAQLPLAYLGEKSQVRGTTGIENVQQLCENGVEVGRESL